MAAREDVPVSGQFDDADSDSGTEKGNLESKEDFGDCFRTEKGDLESKEDCPESDEDSFSEEEFDDKMDKYAEYFYLEPEDTPSHRQVTSKEVQVQSVQRRLVNLRDKVDFGLLDGKASKRKFRIKDKSSRATTDQVLDKRTMLIISRMMSKRLFDRITGSISAGKEANVFRAEQDTDDGVKYFALKVYKTSILTFKNRSKYVDGDFRLRRAYHGKNPRKKVKTWAEKEMRNLSRIFQAGIPCPEPLELKSHLFLMTFIGSDNGAAAPLLLNAKLSDNRVHELYLDLVIYMRQLFFKSRLVHADLSEFNILYHEGKAVIIDVSQSVEDDHPNAMVFLRKDCTNITTFFRNKGVATMLVKELFDFVTDKNITDENMDAVLDAAMEKACARMSNGMSNQDIVDEEVFKNAYIPRTLDEIVDHEREWEKQLAGDIQDFHFHTVSGMKADMSGAQEIPQLLEDSLQLNPALKSEGQEEGDSEEEEEGEEEGEEEKEEEDSDSSKDGSKKKGPSSGRPKDETAEEKRERKQAVKDARKEKLKTKMKKHAKKRALKQVTKK